MLQTTRQVDILEKGNYIFVVHDLIKNDEIQHFSHFYIMLYIPHVHAHWKIWTDNFIGMNDQW